MSSFIKVHVLNEHGEYLTQLAANVEYGNENQTVFVVLMDPDSECDHMLSPYREALNDSMAEQLAMREGYEA